MKSHLCWDHVLRYFNVYGIMIATKKAADFTLEISKCDISGITLDISISDIFCVWTKHWIQKYFSLFNRYDLFFKKHLYYKVDEASLTIQASAKEICKNVWDLALPWWQTMRSDLENQDVYFGDPSSFVNRLQYTPEFMV